MFLMLLSRVTVDNSKNEFSGQQRLIVPRDVQRHYDQLIPINPE